MEYDLKIICECGNAKSLKYIHIAEIHKLFNRFVCSSCLQRRKFKIYNGKDLILDAQNFQKCDECGPPILIPRLKALPHTIHCTSCTYEKRRY